MLKEFKAFILRGNVLDLAVAVVIGAAFKEVIDIVVTGIITPVLAIPGDEPSLEGMTFSIAKARFLYGAVIDEVINFLLIAAAVFFLIVRPATHLMERRKTEPEVLSTTRDCPYCLSSIPIAATRCAFCTADVSASAGG
ncbi:MAG: large conductance mechanosensitive channel protein MscL [Actinomycetota bacterium]|nr:large conductance mechanosensitive channel protein MscL [Actinomycetota bacterium]